MTTAYAGDKPLRSDAAANRERIIRAAGEAFAEHGRDACVEDIAKRAGVGVGTLYRRFPTKAALAEELALSLVDHVRGLAEHAHAHSTPGEALEEFVLALCGLRSRYGRALVWLYGLEPAADRLQHDVRPLVQEMVAEGKAAGRLRPDFDESDLNLLMWSVQGVLEASRDVVPDAWRRHVEYVFAGWRASDAPALVTPAITLDQVDEISRHLGA